MQTITIRLIPLMGKGFQEAQIQIPPNRPLPGIVQWSDRFFVLQSSGTYKEAVCYRIEA